MGDIEPAVPAQSPSLLSVEQVDARAQLRRCRAGLPAGPLKDLWPQEQRLSQQAERSGQRRLMSARLSLAGQLFAQSLEHRPHLVAAWMVGLIGQNPAELIHGFAQLAGLFVRLCRLEDLLEALLALAVVVGEDLVGQLTRRLLGVGLAAKQLLIGAPQGQRRHLAVVEVVLFLLGLLFAAGQLALALGRGRRRWTVDDIGALRTSLVAAHRDRFGTTDDLLVGLQLTHSGRWSRPNGAPEPRLAHAHPLLAGRTAPGATVFTDDELHGLVDAYVAAAVRAQRAGFDFVDVKHCHGYLLHELLTAVDRPGPFGGSFDGRTRFFRTVVERIRVEAPGLAVALRLSAYDFVPFAPGEGRVGRADELGTGPRPFGGDATGTGVDLTETHAMLDITSAGDLLALYHEYREGHAARLAACSAFFQSVADKRQNYYIGNPRQYTLPLLGSLFGFFEFRTTAATANDSPSGCQNVDCCASITLRSPPWGRPGRVG